METKVSFLSITTVVAAMLQLVGQAPAQDALETPSNTEQILSAERRAEARKRAEEGIRYLNELMAKAQAESQARWANLPRKPYDPEAARAAEKERLLAKRRQLAPWLFAADGKPTAEGLAFLENTSARQQAFKEAKIPAILPKVDFAKSLSPHTALASEMSASVTGTAANGPESNPRLELIQWGYDSPSGITVFELWLLDAPLNEWWEIYRAPTLQSTAWRLTHLGPPAGVSDNIQQFFVGVSGQPQQAFFQIFLNQDLDYDGIPDGYEVAIFKTDPLNPDSGRDVNRDGVPDDPSVVDNGRADGDEDFDGDGLSNLYELTIGVNPLVAQSSTDTDADGLPDWLEALITYWTGDPTPAPTADSDGDGLNNKTEWAMRLDPSWGGDSILGDYSNIPDDQRVVLHKNLEFQSPPAGFAGALAANPSDAYFDASFGNYHGTAAELIVLKDTDANGNPAPGVDTLKWGAAYQTPPDFIPAQNIPDPNPADGSVEDADILLQATDTLGDVWEAARMSENLATLSEPTLVHLQHRSFTRIWVKFRTLQRMMVAEELPNGIRLRARVLLGEIHTQATSLRKTTLVLAQNYPITQALATMGRFVPIAGSIASVLSFAGDANDLVPLYAQYMLDVKRRCDNNNDTAADVAVALSNMLDVAFPAPVNTALLWPFWWNALSNFDGWGSSCW